MKRIDKIYQALEELSDKLNKDNILEVEGITTDEISRVSGYLRSNVSFDLNKLTESGLVIKIKQRPVKFISRKKANEIFSHNIDDNKNCFQNISEIMSFDTSKQKQVNSKDEIFSEMIGYDKSLKYQIEQAKAAVMYPPSGLPTLIIGATGVGKSLFAKLMYDFSRQEGLSAGPFVVFNCADYYNNPQLLISHLFGHMKGAFTGANNDKEGLIEKADGGVLFLDEIHRLPPEGQEMVFYTLDNWTFSRLGETERTRKSTFRFICATTENPESSLLKTFIRRIPTVIHLPPLHARSALEKIELSYFLLRQEAKRINRPITIDSNSIKVIIGNTKSGNVGQMKSNIQLICANVFMRSIHSDDLNIQFEVLPHNIKKGIYEINRSANDMREINELIDEFVYINIENTNITSEKTNEEYSPGFNLYRIIEGKYESLTRDGIQKDEIMKYISVDIEQTLSNITKRYSNSESTREKYTKLVSADILDFSEIIKTMVSTRLNRSLDERFLIAFSLHLSSFLEDVKINRQRPLGFVSAYNDIPKPEWYCAKEIVKLIERRFNINVHERETFYLAVLLNSLRNENADTRISVLVIMHGAYTASSMASVVQELIDENNIYAIDMPLDMSPDIAFDLVKSKVNEIDRGKGVLLLVDMGSLVNFGDAITHDTGIKTRTLTMASTPLLIEAVRKTNLVGADLELVYNSLRNFKGYELTYHPGNDSKGKNSESTNKTILAICASGIGTAVKIKKLIEDMLQEENHEDIGVIPVSLMQAKNNKVELLSKYNILFTVGIKDPGFNIPFVPLETLFTEQGENDFRVLLNNGGVSVQNIRPPVMLKNIICESIREVVTYLNPNKIVGLIIEFINSIEMIESKKFPTAVKISLGLHVANVLERIVMNNPLTTLSSSAQESRLKQYRKAASIFTQKIALDINDSELSFIVEMIDELVDD